jgi:chaperone required for assembly of F1-ATPase
MATPATDRPKRFYKAAAVGPLEGGHAVLLDGRAPRTPAGAPLVLPTPSLAALIAAEWERQAASIALDHMPATRLAFTALDRIAAARAETVAQIVGYANADLICYRAPAPAALTAREAAAWDPLLAWARDSLGLAFTPVTGIVHTPQPRASLDGVAALAEALDDFALAGLAYATGLLGSAVLALAVLRGRLTAQAACDLSRVDEAFQEAQWGVDEEAAARTAARRAEAVMIGDWLSALG